MLKILLAHAPAKLFNQELVQGQHQRRRRSARVRSHAAEASCALQKGQDGCRRGANARHVSHFMRATLRHRQNFSDRHVAAVGSRSSCAAA